VTQLETASVAPPLVPFASASAVTAPPGADPPPAHAGSHSTLPRWRSLRGLTRALTALLVVAGGVSLLAVGALVNRLVVLGDIDGFTGDGAGDLLDRAQRADDLVRAAAITYGLVAIAIAILFIIWTWRAAKNNEALGRDLPRLSASWAIAGWLIPLANFVIPVLVIQDLWRGSNVSIPRGDMRWRIADRSALVGWWWASWILSFLRVGTGADASDPATKIDALRASDALGIVGMGFGLAAAALAILAVRSLASRQEETLRAQQAAWAGAHATRS
jgi:Domain of unknown function (DUF4328)